MTDLSGAALPPPSERPSPWAVLVCWCIIFGIVVLIAVRVAVDNRKRIRVVDAPRPPSVLDITGQYAVGAWRMFGSRGSNTSAGELVKAVQEAAVQPVDQLRAATVAGEALGADAALQQLNREWPGRLHEDAELLRSIYRDGHSNLDSVAQQRLVAAHGFYGRLALAFGLPPESSQQRFVSQAAVRTFGIVIGATGVVLAAALAGVILLVIAIVVFSTRRLQPHFTLGETRSSAFLEGFSSYLLGYVGLSLLMSRLTQHRSLLTSLPLALLLPLALAWVRLRGVPWPTLRRAIGWHSGRGIFAEMVCGLGGYIAALPLMALVALLSIRLTRMAHVQPYHPILDQRFNGWNLLLIYFFACILAPIMEETMFRGLLYRHLRQRWGWLFSALVSGLLFAAIHPQGWTMIPIIGMIGFVMASLRQWRDSLIAPMFAHALNNGAVLTVTVLLMN